MTNQIETNIDLANEVEISMWEMSILDGLLATGLPLSMGQRDLMDTHLFDVHGIDMPEVSDDTDLAEWVNEHHARLWPFFVKRYEAYLANAQPLTASLGFDAWQGYEHYASYADGRVAVKRARDAYHPIIPGLKLPCVDFFIIDTPSYTKAGKVSQASLRKAVNA